MKKICIFVFVLTAMISKAQDPHFSQLGQVPLWINPANTGLFFGTIRGSMGFRDQWRSVGTPYSTFTFSADGILHQSMGNQVSIGGYGIFDRSGIKSFNEFFGGVNMSAHVRVGEGYMIGAGLTAGVFNLKFSPEDWSWPSQYDGMHYNSSLPSQENLSAESITKLDVGGGLVFHFLRNSTNPFSNDGVRGKVGIAVFHINRPKQFSLVEEDKRYFKVHFHADASVGIPNSNTAIQPGMLIAIQGPHTEIYPGVSLRYLLKEQSRYTGYIKSSALTIRGYYRLRDAISTQVGFEFSSYFIGFSYDINVSGLTKASKGVGAMEIFLRAVYPAPDKISRGNSPIF